MWDEFRAIARLLAIELDFETVFPVGLGTFNDVVESL